MEYIGYLISEPVEGHMSFSCKICSESQDYPIDPHAVTVKPFPLCDECLKDLREYVMAKRKGKDANLKLT